MTLENEKALVDLAEVTQAVARREMNLKRARRDVSVLGQGGRHVVIGSLNVGSLRGKVEGISELGDAIFLQETMVTKQLSRSIRTEASVYHKTYYVGTHASVTTDRLGRVGPAKGQGLGMLASTDLVWDGECKRKQVDECVRRRIHSGWILLGSLSCVIHNVYLQHAPPTEWPDINGQVMAELVDRITSIQCPRQIVLGDLQRAAHDVNTLQQLIQTGWASSTQYSNSASVVTNHPREGEERMLDAILVSPMLLKNFVSFDVVPVVGMSSHDCVTVTFSVDVQTMPARRLKPPPVFDAEEEALVSYPEEWWVERLHNDDDYGKFAKCVQEWLCSQGISGETVGEVVIQDTVVSDAPKWHARKPGPSKWRLCVYEKILTHLRELIRLAAHENPNDRQVHRIMVLRRCLTRIPWSRVGLWVGNWDFPVNECHILIGNTQMLHQEVLEGVKSRMRRWKNRITESLRHGGREAARWVKEESNGLCCVNTEKEIVACPARIVDEVAQAWRPVFRQNPDWSPGPTASSPADSKEPVVLPALTGRDLYGVLKTKKPHGAAGAEALNMRILKGLPGCVWDWVANLFSRIEAGEDWPSPLRDVRLALLAKTICPFSPKASSDSLNCC